MKFRIRKIIFALISLLIFGLIIFFQSTVNAQVQSKTPNDGEMEPKVCLVKAFEPKKGKDGKVILKKDKDGKEIKDKDGNVIEDTQEIYLRLSNIATVGREPENNKSANNLGNTTKKIAVAYLGDRVSLTIDKLKYAVETDKQFKANVDQLVLKLNNYSFKGIHGFQSGDQLTFHLDFNEDFRKSWKEVISSDWNLQSNQVKVTVGCADHDEQIPVKSGNNDLIINLWHPSRGLIAILPIGLLVFVLFTKEFRDALRGTGITRNRVFSLARVQLAFWSYLIFFSFLILFAITGNYTNIITPQSMILLGISSLTTVGGSLIDNSGDKQLDTEVKNHLAQLDDKYNLWKNYDGGKQITKLESQLKETNNQLKNVELERVKYNDKPQELNQKVNDLNQQKTQLESKAFQLQQAIKKYENWKFVKRQQLSSLKKKINDLEQQSENLLKDILTNPTGEINLHRLQIFVWTIVLGGVYIYTVISAFTTPEFDQNLLTLQGISSGTFLALKSNEPNPKNAKDTPNPEELEQTPTPSSFPVKE